MRVLFVDDEEMITRVVSTWLRRRGHEVVVADTLQGAREQLARHPVEAVLVDVHLGAQSGLELHDWIVRRHPELADRVVFMTGAFVPSSPAEPTAEMRGRQVLSKPFEFAELERVLARLVSVDAPSRERGGKTE